MDFKNEYVSFMNLVTDMRRAQKAYFDARKRHDVTTAAKYLEHSKRMEVEVDQHIREQKDRVQYGEQKTLFK